MKAGNGTNQTQSDTSRADLKRLLSIILPVVIVGIIFICVMCFVCAAKFYNVHISTVCKRVCCRPQLMTIEEIEEERIKNLKTSASRVMKIEEIEEERI
jgi:hypothetical protein